jgi:hypothetical protein
MCAGGGIAAIVKGGQKLKRRRYVLYDVTVNNECKKLKRRRYVLYDVTSKLQTVNNECK